MATLIYNETSQTLTHIPMGLATDVTFSLEDARYSEGNGSRVLASGSPSVASWSLTSTAAAGPDQLNPKRVSVSATAGATVGAPGILVDTDGSRELVEITGVATNSYVELRNGLTGRYAIGSVLYGNLITATIPDAVTTDESLFDLNHELLIRWAYTMDGRKLRFCEPVYFSRNNTDLYALGAIATKLRKLYPDMANRVPEHGNFEAMLSEVADAVVVDLRGRGIEPAQMLTENSGQHLVIRAMVRHMAMSGWSPGSGSNEYQDFYPIAAKHYDDALDALTIGRPNTGTLDLNRDNQPLDITRTITLRM